MHMFISCRDIYIYIYICACIYIVLAAACGGLYMISRHGIPGFRSGWFRFVSVHIQSLHVCVVCVGGMNHIRTYISKYEQQQN